MGSPREGLIISKIKYTNESDVILDELFNARDLCTPLDKNTVKLIKLLGKGANGKVYSVDFDGKGAKEFVLKKMTSPPQGGNVIHPLKHEGGSVKLGEYAKRFNGFRPRDILEINGGDPERVIRPGDDVYIDTSSMMCRTTEPQVLYRSDVYACDREYIQIHSRDEISTYTISPRDKPEIIIPAGTYNCSTDFYSEFVIAQFVSTLPLQNFMKTYIFSSCPVVTSSTSTATSVRGGGGRTKVFYILSEKVDTTLFDISSNPSAFGVTERDYQSIFLQTLFAICEYQSHNITHNDIKRENIGLVIRDDIDPSGVFEYVLEGKKYYPPASKFVVKILDWGYSVRWGTDDEPTIGPETVLSDTGGYFPIGSVQNLIVWN